MVIDGEHRIIVATEVGAKAGDQGQLVPMPDKVNDTYGVEPEVVLADAGCCNEAELATPERRGIDGHAALGREGKARAAVDPRTRPATCRMGEKLAGAQGRPRYAERKWMSEAPNGWIKEAPGSGGSACVAPGKREASGTWRAWR